MPDQQELRIADGGLIVDGTGFLSSSSVVEIVHSPGTRALSGLIVLNGALVIGENASMRIHGLVYASGAVGVGEGASLDVVGSVLAADPEFSFRNSSTTVIRYDPAVLGTPGLRVPRDARVVAWVASWEELP